MIARAELALPSAHSFEGRMRTIAFGIHLVETLLAAGHLADARHYLAVTRRIFARLEREAAR